MKLYEMLHKRWFWLASFAILPVPFIIASQAQRSVVVERFVKTEDERVAKARASAGPDVSSQIRQLTDQAAEARYTRDIVFHRTREYNDAWFGRKETSQPLLADQVLWLGEKLGNYSRQFAEASRQGVYISMQQDSRREYEQSVYREAFTAAAAIAQLMALESGGRGDWQAAEQRLQDAIDAPHAYRSDFFAYDRYLDVTDRMTVQVFDELLRYNPPPEVCRALLGRLQNMHKIIREKTRVGSMVGRSWITQDRALYRGGYFSRTFYERSLLSSAFVNFNIAMEENQLRENDLSATGAQWTALPHMDKTFRKVVDANPELLSQRLVDNLVYEPSPDKYVRALQLWSQYVPGMVWSVYTHRSLLSYLGAMQVAYAARLYRDEQGRWPEKIEDLGPEYAKLAEAPPAIDSKLPEPVQDAFLMDRPFGKLMIGKIAITEGYLPHYLGISEVASDVEQTVTVLNQPNGRIKGTINREIRGRFPEHMLLVEKLMAQKVFSTSSSLNLIAQNTTQPITIAKVLPFGYYGAFVVNCMRPNVTTTEYASELEKAEAHAQSFALFPVVTKELHNNLLRLDAQVDVPERAFAVLWDIPKRSSRHTLPEDMVTFPGAGIGE